MALTPKQERFALRWFEGASTLLEIAKELHVSDRTLNRWKHDPDVQTRVDELIREATIDARLLYARNAVRAAQTILLYMQTTPIYDDKDPTKVIGFNLRYPRQARLAVHDINEALNIVGGADETGSGAQAGPVVVVLPEKQMQALEPPVPDKDKDVKRDA